MRRQPSPVTPLVLASASPRRRDLLGRLGLPFEVRPVDVVEDVGDGDRPDIAVRNLARTKAEAARLLDKKSPIIAADTIVVLDNRILGKPRDPAEARQMLNSLRDRSHQVITAVAFLPEGDANPLLRDLVTSVHMRNYSDAEIVESIDRGDPFDKAGAYGIQDPHLAPVERYEGPTSGSSGCYCNVVGLSLWATIEMLRKADIHLDVTVDQLLPQCADCPLALV